MEFQLEKLIKKFINYVKPDPPLEVPVGVLEASDRFSGSVEAVLSYRSFDEDNNFCFSDDGRYPALGFVVEYSIPESGWAEFYPWFERYLVGKLPADTIVLAGRLSAPIQPQDLPDVTEQEEFHAELEELEHRFLLETSVGPSLIKRSKLNSRKISAYLAVRIPYKGPPANAYAIEKFTSEVAASREELLAKLLDVNGSAVCLDKTKTEHLLRQLCSPTSEVQDEDVFEDAIEVGPFKLFSTQDARYIDQNGTLIYAEYINDEEVEPSLALVPLTVDSYPADTSHVQIQKAIAPDISYSQITCPYWAYTLIKVIDQTDRNKAVELGQLSSKEKSAKVPWFSYFFENERSMEIEVPNQLQILSGLNLYSTLEELDSNIEAAVQSYYNRGFRLTQECFIAFPLYLASLPLQFSPFLDNLNRLSFMNANRVADLAIGADTASDLHVPGLKVFTRAGAVTSLNFEASTNLVLVGNRETGKSIFLGSILAENRKSKRPVFVLTSGKGFKTSTELAKGKFLKVSEATGLSLFSGIKSDQEFGVQLELLSRAFSTLLYTRFYEIPVEDLNKEIKSALKAAWTANKQNTKFKNILFELKALNPKYAEFLREFVPSKLVQQFDTGAPDLTSSFCELNIELVEDEHENALRYWLAYTLLAQRAVKSSAVLAVDNTQYLTPLLGASILVESLALDYTHVNQILSISAMDVESYLSDFLLASTQFKRIMFAQSENAVKAGINNKYINEEESVISAIRSITSYSDSFEIGVEGLNGGYSVYLVIRHFAQYLLYTSSELENARLNRLVDSGYSVKKAILKLSQDYYAARWSAE